MEEFIDVFFVFLYKGELLFFECINLLVVFNEVMLIVWLLIILVEFWLFNVFVLVFEYNVINVLREEFVRIFVFEEELVIVVIGFLV